MLISPTDKYGHSPYAVEKLSSHFSQPLFYQEHNLRHPLGVYNLSLGKIFLRFKDVLRELAPVLQLTQNQDSNFDDSNLLTHTERLLYALMEHMDDCENILKSFYPKGEDLKKQTAFTNFQKASRDYSNHIGKVVNYLKHQNGRLRSITFFNEHGNCAGYFVEGVGEDGSIGPAPIIHSGGNTAFSYSRDLRFHLYYLYFVSKSLCDSIDLIRKSENDLDSAIKTNAKDIFDVITLIQALPLTVFPDEYEKEFPKIAFENSQDGSLVLILQMKHYPHGLKPIKPSSKVQILLKGDGVSRSFRLPYWNGRS